MRTLAPRCPALAQVWVFNTKTAVDGTTFPRHTRKGKRKARAASPAAAAAGAGATAESQPGEAQAAEAANADESKAEVAATGVHPQAAGDSAAELTIDSVHGDEPPMAKRRGRGRKLLKLAVSCGCFRGGQRADVRRHAGATCCLRCDASIVRCPPPTGTRPLAAAQAQLVMIVLACVVAAVVVHSVGAAGGGCCIWTASPHNPTHCRPMLTGVSCLAWVTAGKPVVAVVASRACALGSAAGDDEW